MQRATRWLILNRVSGIKSMEWKPTDIGDAEKNITVFLRTVDI